MWRSVFLHEFPDRIANFQALPGRPTPSSFLLEPTDAAVAGINAVAIRSGDAFEFVLDEPLGEIVGFSARVRLLYDPGADPQLFSVFRLGSMAELLFWPESGLPAGAEGTRALARVFVDGRFRNLGNVTLRSDRFVDFRLDWHASGQARLFADGRLVAYHNAVGPGSVLVVDRVAFGTTARPPAPRPIYHVSRFFVRTLARRDSLSALSRLLPRVESTGQVTDCQQLVVANALFVVDRIRDLMSSVHLTLSVPWTAEQGLASGPFQPAAVDAHALATTAASALIEMLRRQDYGEPDAFLEPFAAFLRLIRDAQPQAFASLAEEIDRADIVPEMCREQFEASETDLVTFSPLIALLMQAEQTVHSIAEGN